jgi:hypothetical protein
LDLSAAAGLLQGVHSVIAMRRGPHWLLSDPDAKAYGAALANALRHLPISMAQKYVDYCALGVAVFAYEGPRIAIDMALKAQRTPTRPPPGPMGPAQVFQFRRPAPGAASEPEAVQPAPPGLSPDMTYEPQLEEAPA